MKIQENAREDMVELKKLEIEFNFRALCHKLEGKVLNSTLEAF